MASVQGIGMLAEHADDGRDDQVTHYVAAHPKRRTAALAATIKHGHPTKITSAKKSDKKTNWQQKVSLICMKLLWKCAEPLSFVGFLLEWSLNFFALNGLFTLPYCCIFHRSKHLIFSI